jgi:hypothetical protein
MDFGPPDLENGPDGHLVLGPAGCGRVERHRTGDAANIEQEPGLNMTQSIADFTVVEAW